MLHRSHCRPATLFPAVLSAALVGLAPAAGHAAANSRDLRGTPVPASACAERDRLNVPGEPFTLAGTYFVEKSKESPEAVILTLRCPLPVNNVDLSGTSNHNRLSKIRVYYLDNDGLGRGAEVVVRFQKTVITPSFFDVSTVCQWDSNVKGSGATGGTSATFACPHDLANNAFYWFEVVLGLTQTSPPGTNAAAFIGINFP
jgi:hypothetical protein